MQEKRRKISAFTIIILFTIACIAGAGLIPLLNVQLNPSDKKPGLKVYYAWQGVSPRIMEQEVTSRLEAGLSRIKGLTGITSLSGFGQGQISLTFNNHADLDVMRFETAGVIRQVYAHLPENVTYPQIIMENPDEKIAEQPLLRYKLNADLPSYLIYRYANEKIIPRLSILKGVDKVNIYGAAPKQYLVEYDMEKAKNLSVTDNELITAIKRHFNKEYLGTVAVSAKVSDVIQILLTGRPTKKTNWENIPVKKVNNKIVLLEDIASVKYTGRKPSVIYRHNGLSSVNILLYKENKANSLVAAREIKNVFREIESSLPAGYTMEQEYDATIFIKEELNNILYRTLFSLAIILVFIFIVYRKWKYAAAVIICLVVNFLTACILYYLTGLEIHLYTLAGLAISIGLIIDNIILMIDHYIRKRDKRVFLALLASTLTTIAALSVIFFMEEAVKFKLKDFGVIIAVNLASSLLVALFFAPAVAKKLKLSAGRKKNKRQKVFRLLRFNNIYGSVVRRLVRYRVIFIIVILLAFGLPVYKLPYKITDSSAGARLYNKTLGNDYFADNIKPFLNKALGGMLRMFDLYVYENSHFTSNEKTTLYVNAELPEGTTIEQTDGVLRDVEKYLERFPQIEDYITSINTPRTGRLTITFKDDYEKGAFPFVLKGKIIDLVLTTGGVEWQVFGAGRGFTNSSYEHSSQIVVLKGFNYNKLEELTRAFSQKLEQQPRFAHISIGDKPSYFKNKSTEYLLDIEKEQLALKELSAVTFSNMLRRYSRDEQPDLSMIIDRNYEQVKIIPGIVKCMDKWMLNNNLLNFGQKSLKLRGIGKINKRNARLNVYKENQEYVMNVSFSYNGSPDFGREKRIRAINEFSPLLPIGYSIEDYTSQLHQRHLNKEKKQYWLVILIIALIFIICSVLLESLIQPLVIIAMIPVSFIGIFLTFYLFDLNFDQGGYAAFLLLSGIVVNSSIYIINDYNYYQSKFHRKSKTALFIKAFNSKIIPIMLTIISTILGLLPFLFFSESKSFWFTLAAGTIGGLVFSFFMLVIYLPVFFLRKKTLKTTI